MNKSYIALLEESFPGIKSTISHCKNLGFSWESLSGKKFIKEKDNQIISHVAVLKCRVLIDNQWYVLAALHAVCTLEKFRGQKLASYLIEEAVTWAKLNSDFQILFTEIPSFYEKFGFTCVQEHRFYLPGKHKKGKKFFDALASPKDDKLFLRCFKNRKPLTKRFWIQDYGQIASFTTFFGKWAYPSYWSLYYCSDFDGFVSWFFEDKTLHLLDIIASELPSLEQILEYLPQDIEKIYFYFPTDSLNIDTIAESYIYDDGQLMVYGKLPIKSPFMIAPLSRC